MIILKFSEHKTKHKK